jgi:hypothetical protein
MNLREQAAADLVAIVEDADAGFGWHVEVTDPNGVFLRLVGQSGDIGKSIDPQTGIAVIGRTAHVSFALATITDLGLKTPFGVADEAKRPWIVRFLDIVGGQQKFKISHAMTDRTIGLVTCLLEAYR